MAAIPAVALAAERLYRESRVGIPNPQIELALRDGRVRRDLERLVVATLAADPSSRDDVAESILVAAVEASGGEFRQVDALDRFRAGRRRVPPPALRRFLDLAGQPSRWGDAYAAAILPEGGGPALFRILAQVEVSSTPRRRRAPGCKVEVDGGFGRDAADDSALHHHVDEAVAAALDFLRTSAPGRPLPEVELITHVRVFRGGLPWPFVRNSYLPSPFEIEMAGQVHSGGSMGLPVALAVLDAFLPGWTTREGPVCAATGEVTAGGTVEAVGEVSGKAQAAAEAELPFLFPRRGMYTTVENRPRQVAVDSLGGAAAEAFNLAGTDVDAFLAKSPSVLYGRDDELAALGAAWDRARRGAPRLALVHGESGIGKSGMVATYLRQLAKAGVPVVFGRAEPFASQVFEPIAGRLVAGLRVDELRAHAADHGAWLGLVVQELRRLLPEHFGDTPAASPQMSLERKSQSLCALIRQCAARLGGLVLVIDDLQWGKEETWPVLRQLFHADATTPLLVIATYRTKADGASPDAEPSLGLLRTAGVLHEVEVLGLPGDVIRRWVSATMPPQPDDLITALEEVTAGNPLQVGNHLEELSKLPPGPELVSQVYALGREVITERLRTFSGLATLKVAAFARSPEFSAQVLGETVLLPPTTIAADLLDAQAASFITAVRRGRYTFHHQLTRDAVRALVPPEEGAQYEMTWGEVLERRAGEYGARLPVMDLARHFGAAAPFVPGAWKKATDYATRAAEEATERRVYQTILEFRTEALRAFELSELDIPERWCRLALDLARATSYVGDEDRAREYFRDVLDLAAAEGQQDLVIEATFGFAGPPEDKGTTDYPLLDFLENAVKLPMDGTDERRTRLRGRWTFENVLAARRAPEDFSMPPVLDILAAAEASGDPVQLTWALLARLMGHWSDDERTTTRLALAQRMLALAHAHGEKDIAAWAHAFRVIHLLELGRRADAEQVVEELAALGLELHYGYARWGAAVLRPVFAHLDGRFAESRQLADKALTLRYGALNSVLYRHIQRILSLREEGELRQVERQFALLRQTMAGSLLQGAAGMVLRTASVLLSCELGDHVAARRELDTLVDHGIPEVLDDPTWSTGLALLAEISAHLDDDRLGSEIYERLLRRSGESIVVALAIACLGAVDRYIGMFAGQQGLWDAASEHFETALITNNDHLRSPVWTAHTQADYAAMLARRARPRDAPHARRLGLSAAATAERLGMPTLQAQAAEVLRKLG